MAASFRFGPASDAMNPKKPFWTQLAMAVLVEWVMTIAIAALALTVAYWMGNLFLYLFTRGPDGRYVSLDSLWN